MADMITLTAEDQVTETTKVTTGYFTGGVGNLAGSNFTTSSLVGIESDVPCFVVERAAAWLAKWTDSNKSSFSR